MSEFKITIAKKGLREEAVKKALKDFENFYLIQKVEKIESRADRLSEAENMVQSAAEIVEELKGELEDWVGNLPENLQNGDKADQLNSAIDALDTLHDELENADFSSVEFPGMY
jgi:flagellar biosynthesis chaperone FliJ